METRELMFIFKSGNFYCFILVLQFNHEIKLDSDLQEYGYVGKCWLLNFMCMEF